MALVKGGPNPDAAKAFLDWAASQATQELIVQEIGRRSIRTDVKASGDLPPLSDIALMNYESTHQYFPPGFSHPHMTMWSAFLLPYIEEQTLYDSIDIEDWTLNTIWRPIPSPRKEKPTGSELRCTYPELSPRLPTASWASL